MKKIILIHIALTILALTVIAFFSLQKIAKAEENCAMWEECADKVYGIDSSFSSNDEENDDDANFNNEKNESRIDRINNASKDDDFSISNTSRNTDKTIGQTVLRGLENR